MHNAKTPPSSEIMEEYSFFTEELGMSYRHTVDRLANAYGMPVGTMLKRLQRQGITHQYSLTA